MEIKDIHPKDLGQFVSDTVKNNEAGHILSGETLNIFHQLLDTTDMLGIKTNSKGFKVLCDSNSEIKTKEPLRMHRREFNREKLLRAMAQEVGVRLRDIDFDILALTYITEFYYKDNSLLNATERGRIRNKIQARKWANFYKANN